MKLGTICTGGGIYEQGAIAHGLTPIWGVEINPRVAEVYKLNYPDSQMVVGDVCNVDWNTLPCPDVLHASPSCRHFSTANNKSEAQKDIAVAEAVGRAIAHFLPQIFTLENVAAYQNSESWTVILNTLQCLGYSVTYQVHKLKYWGVPQKQRNRFIAIALKSNKYQITSNKYQDLSLLVRSRFVCEASHTKADRTRYSLLKENLLPILLLTPNRTRHWYEEIRDLIPEFEPSSLTNTQKDKLNRRTRGAIAEGEIVLLKRNQIRDYTPCAYEGDPYCWSVTATLCTDQNENKRSLFADLVTPGGIYSLNTRALARIQTIPDTYKLSGDVAIDGLVIGDGVPPYFVEQVWGQILSQKYQECDPDSENIGAIAPLLELEKIIKSRIDNLQDFYSVGTALIEIKTNKLYKPEFSNFYRYCSDRFELSETSVKQLVRAVAIKDSVCEVVDKNNIALIEAHCRELAKIKDLEMRSLVLEKVGSFDKITAREISKTYRNMRLKLVESKSKPNLPFVGQTIKLTTKSNKELKQYNNFWAIVTAQNEFTCEARGLCFEKVLLFPQDFVLLKTYSYTQHLLDRLIECYYLPESNDAVRAFIEAIAKRPYPLLEDIDDSLLTALNKKHGQRILREGTK